MSKVNKFLKWLASSKFALAFKVGLGAALSYVLANVSTFNLNPQMMVAVIMVTNVLINALNPQDSKYGIKADSSSADV
jgi:hypothetical protein